MFGLPHIHAQTCSGAVPAVGGTYNGVAVTVSSTGNYAIVTPTGSDIVCGIQAIGTNVPRLLSSVGGTSTGSVTYTFSVPVNNVVINSIYGGNQFAPAEAYTFATNSLGTTTTAVTAGSCNYTQTGNTFTATNFGVNTMAISVTVAATLPFTTLTITGNGNFQNDGAYFNLCTSSITPACLTGTTMPPVK